MSKSLKDSMDDYKLVLILLASRDLAAYVATRTFHKVHTSASYHRITVEQMREDINDN